MDNPELGSFALISARAFCEHADPGRVDNYEVDRLLEAARRHYRRVFLLDPKNASIELVSGERVRVFHAGEDVTALTTLMVRGTRGIEVPTKALVKALWRAGADVVDPVGRFSGVRASKLLTSMNRHEENVGSTTFLAFGSEEMRRVLKVAAAKRLFPLILKPIHGSKGVGVRKLDTEADALNLLEPGQPLAEGELVLLQPFEEIVREFRVLLAHGFCLGVVEKSRDEGAVTANAHQGGSFRRVESPEVVDFTLQNVSHEGILGVDVAVMADGRHIVIEANRAPEWKSFDAAVGIDAAEKIIDIVAARARQS